jgi:hypothetical protein
MSDTPRTDTLLVVHDLDPKPSTLIQHARQLERELAEAQELSESRWDLASSATADVCALVKELAASKERVQLLERCIAAQNLEIEQTCGKALGYPWFKDDQKNFPGSTEADGVCVGEHVAETIVMELANKYTAAQERIKRLVEAGDMLDNSVACGCGVDGPCRRCSKAIENWTAAKEEKAS